MKDKAKKATLAILLTVGALSACKKIYDSIRHDEPAHESTSIASDSIAFDPGAKKSNIVLDFLRTLFMFVLVLIILISGLKVFTYFYEGHVGENYISELKSEYFSQSENEYPVNFEGLKDINADVVGWLKVPGTKIDYPVVQGRSKIFYLSRNLKKEKTIRGSVFIDPGSLGNADGLHTIIYGQNMMDGTMFGNLSKYKNKSFFMENKTIEYDSPEGRTIWEIFSFYVYVPSEADSMLEIDDQKELDSFIAECLERSMHESLPLESTTDRVLTLMTSSYNRNSSVFVIHALPKSISYGQPSYKAQAIQEGLPEFWRREEANMDF